MGVLDGCHKIGRSNDPHGRVRNVGVTLPTRLEVVHAIATADSVWLEVVLHAAFRTAHQSGEWFRMGASDLALFRSMESASTFHDLPHEALARYSASCVVRPKSRDAATARVVPKPVVVKPVAAIASDGTRTVTFGEKLKELRKAAGKSRVDLAVAAGVSAGFVRDLEQGHRVNPSWNTVVAIVTVLGTDCTAFAGCVEVPPPVPPAAPAPASPRKRRGKA